MIKFLKKNWFVALIIVIFACISVYYIYDTNKGKLKGKSSGGEDVVYSVNDTDVTASEFFDKLYRNYGDSSILALFEKAVADESFKTTSEIKETAALQASSIRSNYSSTYGSTADAQLESDLAATGYTDLEEYLITQIKLNKIAGEYAANHFDELQIREISYILIQFEDSSDTSEEPTDDEQARMDAVDASLKDGTSFADTAALYSEDSSTASSGGVLGVIDKNASNLDSSFLSAALSLEEGEISDWVYSSNFGYFKIMCNAATPETLESSQNVTSPYESLVTTYDTTLTTTAVWEKAESLGIDFKGNTKIEREIKAAYGIEYEEEVDPSETTDPEESSIPEETAAPTATAGGEDDE